MSWTVEIVSGHIPADEDEAWEQLDRLRDGAAGREYGAPPSELMQDLYHRLIARYPDIMDNPDSPWADGPLINDFGDELTTLGIIVPRMAEALPFVIETANEMGFTVFDAGNESIHRPKGWTPPLEWSLPQPLPARKWWQFWR